MSAMERRIEGTSLFVLFASKASAASGPVRFEIDRMRLNQAKSRAVRLLVFPIDREVALSDLPPWVQEHWVGKPGLSARDIARHITRVVDGMSSATLKSHQVMGRGALLDAMLADLQDERLLSGQKPNVLVFAGNEGIGRRTLRTSFLNKAYPALMDLNVGPEFDLPQFADLADIYRALRQEIETDFSAIAFQSDLATFQRLDLAAQTQEIANCLDHFGELGQAVSVVTGNGLFEDKGLLKPWAAALFSALSGRRCVKLCVISNRMLHENERRPLPNVIQFHVPALTDQAIRSIMIAAADDRGLKPQLPKPFVIASIGGHPQIAKATARLILRQGTAVLNDDQRELFALQEEILARCLDFSNLSNIERDVLSLLSWVPHLASALMRNCIVVRRGGAPEAFAETLASLERGCLIQVSGPNYLISPPMRALFRRKHGLGSNELRRAFAECLQAEWENAKAQERVPTELVDALLFMAALEGGSFPSEFAGLMLPSTLQELVRGVYDNRHQSEQSSLEQVVRWGSMAIGMDMDDTAREEILSFVARSQSRLHDKAGAEATLRFMDERLYRSRHYLRAFHIRKTGGDLKRAVALLIEARSVRKYLRSVIVDLGLYYYDLGYLNELNDLFKDQADYLDGNPAMLDIQAAVLIGNGDISGAERVIDKMRQNRDDGRADCRTALLLVHKANPDYVAAQRLLTEVLQRGTRGVLPTRRLRGSVAAHAGDIGVAKADAAWLRSQPGGANAAHRIEARVLSAQRRYDEALAELNLVSSPVRQDQMLRARIMEHQANDISMPLALRSDLTKQVAVIRLKNRGLSDFDAP